MSPADPIIKQLKLQQIEFELMQSDYNPSEDSVVSQAVKKWRDRFIGQKTAPHLDHYLWHIFSIGATNHFEGIKATEELKKQSPSPTLIFNEPQQYLIKCSGTIPKLEMEDFFDDIYLCDHNMNWTYVLPHEIPDIGPYFSMAHD